MASITRSIGVVRYGSTLNFNLPTTGSIVVNDPGAGQTTGILGSWITVNNTDWAVAGSVNQMDASTLFNLTAAPGYAVSGLSTTALGVGNVNVQASNSTAWNSQTVGTLRFNSATPTTLTIGSGQTLTLASG